MPSLHPPPAEPPVLLPEDPPQVDDILAKIEPWITDHFRETLSSDVPDETQLYGCVNTFLISIFPARRHYMIIPQMLGRVMAEDESEGGSAELGDFGSSGGVHESKHLGKSYSVLIQCHFNSKLIQHLLQLAQKSTRWCLTSLSSK